MNQEPILIESRRPRREDETLPIPASKFYVDLKIEEHEIKLNILRFYNKVLGIAIITILLLFSGVVVWRTRDIANKSEVDTANKLLMEMISLHDSHSHATEGSNKPL